MSHPSRGISLPAVNPNSFSTQKFRRMRTILKHPQPNTQISTDLETTSNATEPLRQELQYIQHEVDVRAIDESVLSSSSEGVVISNKLLTAAILRAKSPSELLLLLKPIDRGAVIDNGNVLNDLNSIHLSAAFTRLAHLHRGENNQLHSEASLGLDIGIQKPLDPMPELLDLLYQRVIHLTRGPQPELDPESVPIILHSLTYLMGCTKHIQKDTGKGKRSKHPPADRGRVMGGFGSKQQPVNEGNTSVSHGATHRGGCRDNDSANSASRLTTQDADQNTPSLSAEMAVTTATIDSTCEGDPSLVTCDADPSLVIPNSLPKSTTPSTKTYQLLSGTLLHASLGNMYKLSNKELITTVWSLGRLLGIRKGEVCLPYEVTKDTWELWSDELLGICSTRMYSFNPQDISCLILSVSRLDLNLNPTWLSRLLTRAAYGTFQGFSPQQLSSLMYAIGKLCQGPQRVKLATAGGDLPRPSRSWYNNYWHAAGATKNGDGMAQWQAPHLAAAAYGMYLLSAAGSRQKGSERSSGRSGASLRRGGTTTDRSSSGEDFVLSWNDAAAIIFCERCIVCIPRCHPQEACLIFKGISAIASSSLYTLSFKQRDAQGHRRDHNQHVQSELRSSQEPRSSLVFSLLETTVSLLPLCGSRDLAELTESAAVICEGALGLSKESQLRIQQSLPKPWSDTLLQRYNKVFKRKKSKGKTAGDKVQMERALQRLGFVLPSEEIHT